MRNWTDHDLQDYADVYWNEVVEDMKEDGLDPSTPPTRSWCDENGWSGYYQAIGYHTDYTFREFCEEILGISRYTNRLHNLKVEDDRTRELAYQWAEKHQLVRRDLKEGSVVKNLYAIDVVARILRQQTGSDDLVTLGSESTPEPESFEVFLNAFDQMKQEYSDRTVGVYLSAVKRFYDYLLKRQNPVEYNPVIGLRDEYSWDLDTGDPVALTPDQVRALAWVAETAEEKAIVVLHCAAGLRRNEVAKIHRSMLKFDPADHLIDRPIIDFESRKNGPSTVNLVLGIDVLQERIDELEDEKGDGWSGHLFPSPYRNREHLSGEAIKARFDRLVERAEAETDVQMNLADGSLPTPQTARRYWYNQYSKGIDVLFEVAASIADEQGSSDPSVVINNYLSEQRRLEILRGHMTNCLSEAFEGTDLSPDRADQGGTDLDVLDVDQEAKQRTRLNEDAGGEETPVDRFLQENTTEDTTTEEDSWLSSLSADESGFLTSTGATKAAGAATVLTLLMQLLLLF